MDDNNKIKIQGQIISDLNSQINQLNQTILELQQENKLLKVSLEENELQILNDRKMLDSMIEEYRNILDEMKEFKKMFREEDKEYKKDLNDSKKQLKNFLKINHI